ncbi:transposase [Azospirillum canadense]|nr:transposase [Azospirillum canadense]
MMTKGWRFFTDEFKQEAVALLESSGRPLEHIAKELDIQPSVLRNWRRRVARPGGRRSSPYSRRRPPWPAAIRPRRLPA